MANATQRGSVLRSLTKEWPVWVCGAVASFFLASILISGWPGGLRPNLAYPFAYEGDALSHLWLVKRALEGWILENPRSGYPFGSDFFDYPIPETGSLLCIKFLGVIAGSYVAVFNLFILLSFPLTFLSAYCGLRYFGLLPAFAVSGSFLFCFLPFQLQRIPHLFYLTCFVVPAYFAFAFFFYRNRNHFLRCRRLRAKYLLIFFALFVLSAFGAYYAFFGALVMGAAAVFIFFKSWKLRKALPAVIGVACLFGGLFLNTAPNTIYSILHGKNSEIANRPVGDSEMYGLKLIQMAMPRLNHRVSEMAALTSDYSKSAPLVNENSTSSLGVVGAIGFLIVLAALVSSAVGVRWGSRLSLLAVITCILFLFGTVGGLGALFAQFVTTTIRSWNRISMFIAFGTIATALLALQSLIDVRMRQSLRTPVIVAAAVLITLVGLFDQTAAPDVAGRERARREFVMDRDLVGSIEAALPAGSAVFQMPYMAFPEVPPLPSGLTSYQLLTGFLHSDRLRWNHGGIKGRSGDAYFRDLSSKPLSEQLAAIQDLGFSGIYLDRRGYSDSGNALATELTSLLGYGPLTERSDGKISFFKLPRSKNAGIGNDQAEQSGKSIRKGEEIKHDSPLLGFEGWSYVESGHRWTEGTRCTITLAAEGAGEKVERISLRGWPNGSQRLGIAFNGVPVFSGRIDGNEQTIVLPIPRGVWARGGNVLSFELPDARPPENGDPRVLGFALKSLKIE